MTENEYELIADILIKVEDFKRGESEYGCPLREITKLFIECKDTCKECWIEYLKTIIEEE